MTSVRPLGGDLPGSRSPPLTYREAIEMKGNLTWLERLAIEREIIEALVREGAERGWATAVALRCMAQLDDNELVDAPPAPPTR